jgi:transcriptional regulator with PAS, ATPase and Fis domain
MSLKDQERDFIHKVLEMSNYNTGLTSKILKIPRTTLWRKMKKYNIGNVNPVTKPD